jgi:pimeloyl-ACP methyl ester carboxylesterase
MFRAAMLTNATAHCALEYHRWALRSIPRRDGRRFISEVSRAVAVPVLQLHGANDPAILLSSALGSGEHVGGPYAMRAIEGVGHFPHEEAPDAFDAALLPWIETLPRD